MTVTSNIQGAGVPSIPHHHSHSRNTQYTDDPLTSGTSTTAGVNSGSTVTSSSLVPTPTIQKFASELQSILLSAQAGQPSATDSTANDSSTAANPGSALDPTKPASGGSVRHVADRLQQLLGSGHADSSGQETGGLQDILNRLQQTLAQTLQSYGGTGTTSSSSLTS